MDRTVLCMHSEGVLRVLLAFRVLGPGSCALHLYSGTRMVASAPLVSSYLSRPGALEREGRGAKPSLLLCPSVSRLFLRPPLEFLRPSNGGDPYLISPCGSFSHSFPVLFLLSHLACMCVFVCDAPPTTAPLHSLSLSLFAFSLPFSLPLSASLALSFPSSSPVILALSPSHLLSSAPNPTRT